METLVNGIVLLMLLAVGIFLLRMKVKMDLPELRKDYRFMETFGMGEKERTGLLKREISRYVRIPLLLGAGVSLVLTGILWKLRLYQTSDMTDYLKWGLLVWGAYILIQIMNMKLIQLEMWYGKWRRIYHEAWKQREYCYYHDRAFNADLLLLPMDPGR